MNDRFVSIYNKEVNYNLPENINIYDTTLRDGEQTPGVCFSLDEKIEIAHKLDELGIPQIEAGFPIVSENEKKSVKTIANEGLNAKIICLTRTKKEDIDAALDADVDGIITFMGLSDLHLKVKMDKPRDVINKICMDAVDYGKDHGLFVAFSAEDATRTELPKLLEVYKMAQEHKADRIHIADTTGSINPYAMQYLVRNIRKEIDVEIALHCHNDFGFAVANSIAGLFEGASAISTTVNGIGERAGNASLEELIMALKLLYNKDLGFKTEVISELSQIVSKYSKIPVPDSKAIVGNNVFRHESGIHVDAIVKDPFSYEPFLPEMIGTKRQIVLGKHSGKAAIEEKLDSLKIKVDNEKLLEIVKLVKEEREKGFDITNEKFDEILLKANVKR
ncbi:MAG: homocitrate synthase family protein [Methanosphaera sp.]|uniref:homocitrate synthase family protein n=1 Tax=Methanosphaera sp. TaxID=2666342 RepID=UPI002E7746CE|nr:homocitrate synthase family protein [Methanosphaera sp.]MEE1117741.1 homocitrate synthase family protein [Methanosphaera sp.]MEE3324599.1 homocitrate synthase family protein [Methanosphaera sp.]